ncbi:hypothetical protein RJ639_040368 [Escallonia herrerae]|uniref:Transcription factor CBF/NF-Y/archaeal histone domain-containing protein n=1 Tax=Escallonia herrerae TaxID=1293975 RepID=A0AA89B7B0_9ASTE|nr:hypothetical protein RJ639_040368 [Escallonia herrerae]
MAEKAVAVAAEKAVAAAEELPKTIVRRVVKEQLSQLSREGEISVLREALLALSESSRIFIHYLSATANDICRESKRQTINAEDVFKALEEIEFAEFVEPLRASLEGKVKVADLNKGRGVVVAVMARLKRTGHDFRQKNAGKKSGSRKVKETKKGKEDTQMENGDDGKHPENNDDKDDYPNNE